MIDTSTRGARSLQDRLEQAAGLLRRPPGEGQPRDDVDPVRPAEQPGTSSSQSADPLVLALLALARHHGFRPSPARLVAGLPLDAGRLPRDHLAAAADRAGLTLTPTRIRPSRLAAHQLPALAFDRAGLPLIIEAVERRGVARIQAPASTDLVTTMPAVELDREVTRVLLVAPRRATGRASPADMVRHSVLAGNRGLYAQAILATVVVNLLALTLPLYTMNVYDRVLPNGAMATLMALSIGVVLGAIFDFVLRTLRQVVLDTAARRADATLAMQVFARTMGARLARRPSAVGIDASTLRELETVREFHASLTLTALGDIPFALLFIAVIAWLAGPLALVPLIAVPIVLLLVLATQRPLARLADDSFTSAASKNAVLVETLTGLETIKAMGAESWAARRWEIAYAEHLRISHAIRFVSSLGLSIVASAQTLATVAMIVAGAVLVTSGQITAGALMAAMMLLSRALAPMAQVAGLASRLHQARVAEQALQRLVAGAQEREEADELIAAPALAGRLEFEGVRFTYDADRPPVLAGVDLTIAPGERVGLLGTVGSGKSTLLKLVARLHEPDAGRILVDGLGLGALDPAWLRGEIGYLGQDAHLFSGTIRENLLLHRSAATDDDILRAAEIAGARDWIGRLPRGLDTRLGERGAGLSGGQRRTLALARALVGRPRLLLLDEPTSEMDQTTEARLVANLRREIEGTTLLLVTHKPAALALVDRLVVLNNGRLLHDGPKADVLGALRERRGLGAASGPNSGSAPAPTPITLDLSRIVRQGAQP